MQTEIQSGSPGQHPITRVDAPGKGGASHAYVILGLALVSQNPSYNLLPLQFQPQRRGIGLLFQQGAPGGGEDDPQSNGIHSEDLLAILIDRHEGFAQGPFNCPENDEVVAHLKAALALLDSRRARRQQAGVLGQQVADPPEIPPLEENRVSVAGWRPGDFVFFAGSEYEIAEAPAEGFVGIYDERPHTDHIDFVKLDSVTFSRVGEPAGSLTDSGEGSSPSSEESSTGSPTPAPLDSSSSTDPVETSPSISNTSDGGSETSESPTQTTGNPPVSDTSPDSSSGSTEPANTGSGNSPVEPPLAVEEMTAKELYDEAVSRDIPGRSSMSKEELQTAVTKARKA